MSGNVGLKWINPFQVNVPFLYLLKTLENLWFYDVFVGYRNSTLAWKGITHSMQLVSFYTPWKHQKAIGMKEASGMKCEHHMNISWTFNLGRGSTVFIPLRTINPSGTEGLAWNSLELLHFLDRGLIHKISKIFYLFFSHLFKSASWSLLLNIFFNFWWLIFKLLKLRRIRWTII